VTDTVLFDLFGVIAHDQASDGRDRLVSRAGVGDVGERAFWDAYWQLRPPYDQGLTTGPCYWQQVARSLGTGFDDRQIADLVAADIASWSSVDGAMVDLLGELASSGLRLALLSNIPEELAVHYDRRQAWLDHFELRAYSCRIGHAKPQPAAFAWCLDALDTRAEQVLFVDDRSDNIRAARSLGLHTHLFTTPAQLREQLVTGRVRAGDAEDRCTQREQ